MLLNWINNSNFLLDQSTGDFVAILPHDDWIPSDFYEKLSDCLLADEQVVNCFPVLHYSSGVGKGITAHQKELLGSVSTRVNRALDEHNGISYRGLIRRPESLSMQPFHLVDLPENFYLSDHGQIMATATRGKLKEVNAPTFSPLPE